MKAYEMTTIMIVYVASWTSHNMSLSSVKLCITRVLCIDYATVTVEIRWAAIIFLPEIWLLNGRGRPGKRYMKTNALFLLRAKHPVSVVIVLEVVYSIERVH